MEESINKEDEQNKLRIENEIKKFKISLEHGASFFSPSEKKLSPEMESQWLDQVQQFEDSYAKSKRVVIYDLIGKPAYKPVNEIPNAEIKDELKKIINLLGQKGVGIDTICKVDDRELYRFITEELFMEETDDIMIDGMTHNFIYEEFHPNHAYDIKAHYEEYIKWLFNKKTKINPSFLAIADEIHIKGGVIKKEDAIKKMEIFREAFRYFKIQHFKIISLKIVEDVAYVCFDISYTGVIEGSNEKKTFSGMGNFELKNEYNYWCINKINIPGIAI